MNKQDLVKAMANDAGITQEQAGHALQAFEFAVSSALAEGEKVTLVGFGTFSVSQRKARTGRNPKTGEALQIPAKTVVKFKAGKGLEKAIN